MSRKAQVVVTIWLMGCGGPELVEREGAEKWPAQQEATDPEGAMDPVAAGAGEEPDPAARGPASQHARELRPREVGSVRPDRPACQADVDGDGFPDLITVHREDDVVTVAHGHPGGYGEPMVVTVGRGPNAVVATDVDHDDDVDLVVSHDSGQVWVMGARGVFGFSRLRIYSVGDTATTLAAADVNNDGTLDFATIDMAAGLVIMVASAEGMLEVRPTIRVGGQPHAVAFGDVDGDGWVDAFVAREGQELLVLRGDGTGHFTPNPPSEAGSPASGVEGSR